MRQGLILSHLFLQFTNLHILSPGTDRSEIFMSPFSTRRILYINSVLPPVPASNIVFSAIEIRTSGIGVGEGVGVGLGVGVLDMLGNNPSC